MIPDFTLLSLDFRVKTFYNIRESKRIGTYCVESGFKQSIPVGTLRNPRTIVCIISHILIIVNNL